MKKFSKCIGITVLTAIFLLGFWSMAWAEYEIDNIQTSVLVGVTPQQGPADDLEVSWDEATIVGGALLGYVYIWNDSNELLDDTQLNQSTNDGTVSAGLNPPTLIQPKEFFADDEFDDIRYLHIKTSYLSFTEGPQLSTDVVVGPFNFDNVPPTGTIALDPSAPGQTATTSSVNPVTLTVAATADTEAVYLGRTTTFAVATRFDFASTLEFEVSEGTGTKNIFAWFEDEAGNVSASPVQLTFELIAGKTMSPSGAVTIEVGGTQTFTIQGAQVDEPFNETFTWEIINADPLDVASFVGDSTGVTVEVSGDKEGTFRVQATSSLLSADVYTSGTITVAKFTDTITHNYKTGLNVVPFTFTGTGIVKASDLDSAIVTGNPGVAVSQIFGWDGLNQRFATPYVNLGGGFVIGDFDLVPGAAYFVQVNNEASVQISGVDYTTCSLYSGLNLMAVPYGISATVTTASGWDQDIAADTGLTCSQIFGWDAVNQRFSTPYVNLGGGFVIGDFTLSVETQGYFIQVSGDGTYEP